MTNSTDLTSAVRAYYEACQSVANSTRTDEERVALAVQDRARQTMFTALYKIEQAERDALARHDAQSGEVVRLQVVRSPYGGIIGVESGKPLRSDEDPICIVEFRLPPKRETPVVSATVEAP